MTDGFLLVASCAVAALGFAMMAFSQKQHWPLLSRAGSTRPPAWLRPSGSLLLIFAAIPAILRDGAAFGLLLWAGLLTVSALMAIALIARLQRHTDSKTQRDL